MNERMSGSKEPHMQAVLANTKPVDVQGYTILRGSSSNLRGATPPLCKSSVQGPLDERT